MSADAAAGREWKSLCRNQITCRGRTRAGCSPDYIEPTQARIPAHGWPQRLRRALDTARRNDAVRYAGASLPAEAWRAGSPDRPSTLVHGDWHLGQLGRRSAAEPWLLIPTTTGSTFSTRTATKAGPHFRPATRGRCSIRSRGRPSSRPPLITPTITLSWRKTACRSPACGSACCRGGPSRVRSRIRSPAAAAQGVAAAQPTRTGSPSGSAIPAHRSQRRCPCRCRTAPGGCRFARRSS